MPVIEINYFFLIVVLLMYLSGYLNKFLLIFASIFLHELGHIVAAVSLNRKVYAVKILSVGLNATIEERSFCERADIAICLSGPLVNMFLFLTCRTGWLCFLFIPGEMDFLTLINLYLLLFNMTPILPMDGGRILRSILSREIGLILADRYTRRISAFIIFLITAAGIIQIAYSLYNFSLIIAGGYFLLVVKNEHMEAALMNVKQLIFRRSRLLKKGIYASRTLVVVESTLLCDAIQHMDFDRFHIVYVLDELLKVIKIFSEQEIMDAMLKYDGSLSFKKLIELQKDEGQKN